MRNSEAEEDVLIERKGGLKSRSETTQFFGRSDNREELSVDTALNQQSANFSHEGPNKYGADQLLFTGHIVKNPDYTVVQMLGLSAEI